MSDTTESLRRKLQSAGDLQSVVRMMKSLAASSIGQYERSVRALEGYDRTVKLGLAVCLRRSEAARETVERSGASAAMVTGAVVFGSDQGLVGRFNEAVVDHAMKAMASLPGKHRVWAVGERVHARLLDAGVPLSGRFEVPGSVQAIGPLVGKILIECVSPGDGALATELHLFYNHPTTSAAAYEPLDLRLLPLDEAWRRELVGLPWPTRLPPEVLGDATSALRALLREHLYISLFRACAESLASENASRLAAMQRAEKNIDDLLEDLHGTFHRLRQSGIDEELFDVIAGFEALKRGPRRPGSSSASS